MLPAGDGATVAERYGAARSFLSQQAHLAHPYLPRAVAANLMVRRAAFERVGGFYEGVRAAEDTDFSWRLQRAGWRLELRPQASVEHRYRATLRELRVQWRGYAAGRAWLRRRYQGFEPEPAVRRGLGRAWGRCGGLGAAAVTRIVAGRSPRRSVQDAQSGRLDRAQYLALDALLAVDELAGFMLSNRPERGAFGARARWCSSPTVSRSRATRSSTSRGRSTPPGSRRAGGPSRRGSRSAARLRSPTARTMGWRPGSMALLRLAVRHPVRCARDFLHRAPGEPTLTALAPAVVRLIRQPGARVHPLGGEEVQATARRLAALAGRPLADPRRD